MENKTEEMEVFDKLERAKLSCGECGDPLWYDEHGHYHCISKMDHHTPFQSGIVPKAI